MPSLPVPRLSGAALVAATRIGSTSLDIAPATLNSHRSTMRRMIEYLAADPLVTDVTQQQYADWHDWLSRGRRGPLSVNNYRRAGRSIWHRLRARGYAVCDIEGLTRLIPIGPPPGKAVPTDWLTRALAVCNSRDTAIILYMLEGGFRRQTVGRLRAGDTLIWQGPDGRFRIASRIPQEKTSPPRLIMAGHRAAVAVMNWLNVREYQDSPWLFCALDDGGQLSNSTVNSLFRVIRRRANIPAWVRFHPHALRHTYAQNELQSHDAQMVAQWMGISVQTLLGVYAVRSQEQLAIARYGDDAIPRELFTSAPLGSAAIYRP